MVVFDSPWNVVERMMPHTLNERGRELETVCWTGGCRANMQISMSMSFASGETQCACLWWLSR